MIDDPLMQRLRAANPVPDPDAEDDPAAARTLMREVLAQSSPALRAQRRRVPVVVAAVAVTAAVISLLALVASELRHQPDRRAAVLAAFAADLRREGQVLHLTTTTPSAPGRAPYRMEGWILLEDPRHQRWVLGSGPGRLEQAIGVDPASGVPRIQIYRPGDNTVWTATRREDLPVLIRPIVPYELARVAQSRDVTALLEADEATVRGRRALRVRVGEHVLYVAAESPVLLRSDKLDRRGRVIERTEVVEYALLPAQRRLLEIPLPTDVRRGTPPKPPAPLSDREEAMRRRRRADKRACAARPEAPACARLRRG